MNFFTRLLARIHGEVAADDLQGYRRAGTSVYDLVAEIDQHRLDEQLAGHTAWTASQASQVAALCSWNAFALQTIGDSHLDVHDRHGAAGFAREQTHEQVLAYYRSVQEWVERGREAEATSGDYKLSVRLPALLPGPQGAWRQPYPELHIVALRQALDVVGTRAEAAARDLLAAPDAGQHPVETTTARQLLGVATTAGAYAVQAASTGLADSAQTAAGAQLHAALQQWYELGQLAVMPSLLSGFAALDGPPRIVSG